jgi:hypothetical protein
MFEQILMGKVCNFSLYSMFVAADFHTVMCFSKVRIEDRRGDKKYLFQIDQSPFLHGLQLVFSYLYPHFPPLPPNYS